MMYAILFLVNIITEKPRADTKLIRNPGSGSFFWGGNTHKHYSK
jgi:hypothetical protein